MDFKAGPQLNCIQGNEACGFLMCLVSTVSLTDNDSKWRLVIQEIFTGPGHGPDTVEDTNYTAVTRTDIICALTCAMCYSIFA